LLCAESRRIAAKFSLTVENDREKIFVEWRALSARARVGIAFLLPDANDPPR
jgi:hypothetical protein